MLSAAREGVVEKTIERKLAAIFYADVAGYSRLTGGDEVGTHRTLSQYLDLIADMIQGHNGSVLHYAGDAVLAEFASVVVAATCAVKIQRELAGRNADVEGDHKLQFRIGINLGDVIVDRDELYGEGVNIAARLEGLADPGGICVSASVRDQIWGKVDFGFEDMGAQTVKNIAEPVRCFHIRIDPSEATSSGQAPSAEQDVRFCIAPDGVQIAYATAGSGPPLVKAPNWMSHLEFEWHSPIWRHLLRDLCRDHTLVRFDQRLNGLSDREAQQVSLDAFVADLETVVDTLGLERFPLLGISQGCAISIAYTIRHPERVSRLVLHGGFARGAFKRGQAAREQAEATIILIKHGWGSDNPAFRQMFTSTFFPGATPEQMEWFNELQRVSSTPDNAARTRVAVCDFDIQDRLGEVAVPTLVLHCQGDAAVPFDEGRRMAAMIPGARLVALECDNHLILEHEPAWARFQEEVHGFLAAEPRPGPG